MIVGLPVQGPVAAGLPSSSNGGQTLVTDPSGNPTFTNGGYITLIDLDFTAQPNQAINADGAAVIAGKTWQKVNSASETTHTRIVNGTGLVVDGANGAYNPAAVAMPYLWLPLSQVLGSVPADWSSRIRIYTSLGAEVFAGGHTPNGYVTGICNNSAGLTQDNGIFFFRGQPTGGVLSHNVFWARVGGNAPQVLNTDDSITPALANSTLCFDMSSVGAQCVAPQGYHGANLAAGTAFPNLSTLNPDVGAENGIATAKMGGTVSTFANMGFLLGASSQGGGGYTTVVQRIRIDLRV